MNRHSAKSACSRVRGQPRQYTRNTHTYDRTGRLMMCDDDVSSHLHMRGHATREMCFRMDIRSASRLSSPRRDRAQHSPPAALALLGLTSHSSRIVTSRESSIYSSSLSLHPHALALTCFSSPAFVFPEHAHDPSPSCFLCCLHSVAATVSRPVSLPRPAASPAEPSDAAIASHATTSSHASPPHTPPPPLTPLLLTRHHR